MFGTSSPRARIATLALVSVLAACSTMEPQSTMVDIHHLNPAGMHSNPAFSQAISVEGPHRTLYIGGQNAVDGSGQIVGVGNIAAQAAQVARNVRTVLDAADAGPNAIVKWTIHVVSGHELLPAMQAFQQELGGPAQPATVTVLYVSGLAHPDFLIEIDAVAVLPLTGA